MLVYNIIMTYFSSVPTSPFPKYKTVMMVVIVYRGGTHEGFKTSACRHVGKSFMLLF